MIRFLLNKIVLLINLVCALALLMSYASMYVSPALSWLPAFLGLAYPYLLCVNIGFVCFWLVKFHANCLISLFIILSGFGLIGRFIQIPFFKPDVKTTLTQAGISMLSYNVRGLNFKNNKGKTVPSDTLYGIIAESDCKIICFQEFPVSLTSSFETALSERTEGRIYKHAVSTDENIMGNGNATFSTYPVIGGGKIELSTASNLCIYTDLKIGRDTVRIYNCHLHSNRIINDDLTFLENMGKEYNSKQINTLKEITFKLKNAYTLRSQQVDSIASHIRQSPYRVVVCGDFNDTPVSYTYRKMREDMQDAFVKAGQWTSSTYQRGIYSFRIDYIFCDSGMKFNHYRCVPYILSDHYPVFCNFTILAQNSK